MINLTFIIAGVTPGAPAPDIYKAGAKRFADTYRQFPAGAEHRLFLVDSNGGLTPEIRGYFEGMDFDVITYRGTGWDIGAHQFSAMTMSAEDWVMCFSSWAHFRQPGWLKAFVDAREIHGDGLYGSTSSFENNPHIRGTGFFVRCGHIHGYPYVCNSREESFLFESGPDSLSQWCMREGFGAWLVTPKETVPLMLSRLPENVYRKGDQSNIWTFDKHTEMFERATPKERIFLAASADAVIVKRDAKMEAPMEADCRRLWSLVAAGRVVSPRPRRGQSIGPICWRRQKLSACRLIG